MHTLISLLRGINVSGQKKIRMADLREMYEQLGMQAVQSYLQSGNVVFSCRQSNANDVAASIKAAIKQNFGFDVPVLVRGRSYFEGVIENNPFLADRKEDPAKLHLTFLAATPSKQVVKNLIVPPSRNDEFVIAADAVYVFCPDGYGRTKLNNNFFERKLAVAATTRNWKTVGALYQMAADLDP